MMTLEFEYFERACEMQVLPQPKAPGIAVVPPCTHGNNASNTLCPVSRGWLACNFSLTGRGCRTGHT